MIKGLAGVPVGTPLVTDDGTGPITPYPPAQRAAPANGIPSDSVALLINR
jgi:hypothetical protein